MSAPFRVVRSSAGTKDLTAPTTSQNFKDYLDRLLKMVPGEVIGLYLIGSGLIPTDQLTALVVWSVVCLLAVIVVRAFGTADKAQNLPTDWLQVAIASVAFVIWLYSIGGPFVGLGVHVPYVGSLLVLAWSFFVPLVYKGAAE